MKEYRDLYKFKERNKDQDQDQDQEIINNKNNKGNK